MLPYSECRKVALCGLIRPRAGKVFLGTYLCCSKKVLERKPEPGKKWKKKSFLRSCFLSVADPGALHRSAVKAHPATARVNKRYIRYIRYKAYYEMWKSHSKKWHRAHACRLCGLGVVRFSCAFKARSWASLKYRDQWEFQKLFHRYDILQSQRCNRFHNQKFKADLAQLLLEDAKVTNQLLKDTRVHRLHMRETNNWSIKHPNEFSSKLQKAKRSLWFEKE